MIIIDNLHYNLFHAVMSEQKPQGPVDTEGQRKRCNNADAPDQLGVVLNLSAIDRRLQQYHKQCCRHVAKDSSGSMGPRWPCPPLQPCKNNS